MLHPENNKKTNLAKDCGLPIFLKKEIADSIPELCELKKFEDFFAAPFVLELFGLEIFQQHDVDLDISARDEEVSAVARVCEIINYSRFEIG